MIIVTYLLCQRTWSGPEWQRRLRSGSFYICLVHWQASMSLYVVPTHMAAACISSAYSTVKTVGITWNLAYERKCSDPRFIELRAVLRCTFSLGDLGYFGWSKLVLSVSFRPTVTIRARSCILLAKLHFLNATIILLCVLNISHECKQSAAPMTKETRPDKENQQLNLHVL